MANYRKSFNFRNGVQVDDDNLVVNSNGLVGIGTTVPSELLDVRGTAKVVGLVTTDNLYVSGISTLSDVTIGTGITISASSGIITANYFYGDGSTLSNLPTSQWTDVDVGLGFTSIYNSGYVGVATTDPRSTLQIGGNPNNSENGVGLSSIGNIRASGIITASSFDGSGANLTALNASNISSGTISLDRIPTLTNSKIPSSISVSGVITATSGFVGNLTGNVTGDVVGIATTARSLTGTPDITVGAVTASTISASSLSASGIVTATTELNVGSGGTALTALSNGRLGVGTANPGSDLQVRKESGSLLEVISDSGESKISVGNSVGAGSSSAILRFGNKSATLDLVNNDYGDIQTIIHDGTGVGATGNFKWIYGQTNDELMTLTYDGNLGINEASPTEKLHVGGGATVDGSVYIQNDLEIGGSFTGNINYPSVINGTNLKNTSGITTLNNLEVTNEVDFYDASIVGMTTVSIGTTIPDSYYSSVVGLTVDNVISTNQIVVSELVAVASGVVTAATVSARFNSSDSTDSAVAIEVLTSPDRIVFSVAGIGSTSFQLF